MTCSASIIIELCHLEVRDIRDTQGVSDRVFELTLSVLDPDPQERHFRDVASSLLRVDHTVAEFCGGSNDRCL